MYLPFYLFLYTHAIYFLWLCFSKPKLFQQEEAWLAGWLASWLTACTTRCMHVIWKTYIDQTNSGHLVQFTGISIEERSDRTPTNWIIWCVAGKERMEKPNAGFVHKFPRRVEEAAERKLKNILWPNRFALHIAARGSGRVSYARWSSKKAMDTFLGAIVLPGTLLVTHYPTLHLC